MGKSIKNSRKRKPDLRMKHFRSKIKELVGSNAHALQEKYKHILGCRQPIVMLERCSILKNISHLNCLQVSLKNSINNTCNANDIKKLVHSTNHVSHQSPCVEKTNLTSVDNLEAVPTMKKINYSSSQFSSISSVFENVSQISRTHSKRATSLNHKSMLKIDKSDSPSSLDEIMREIDTKHEVNVKCKALQNGRSLKICLKRIVLYDNNSNAINVAHNLGQLQKNNLNESVAKSQKCNTNTTADDTVKSHKRTKSTGSSTTDTVFSSPEDLDVTPLQERLAIKESTILENNASCLSTGSSRISTLSFQSPEKLKVIQLQEKLIELQKKLVPSSNKLSELTEKHTVAHTQKNTITNKTEETLSEPNNSFINSSANTVQYSERFIVPSSNELSKSTKIRRLRHTRKSTTMEDALSASTRNLTNSSTNAVQSSGTLVTQHSNDSNKQIKESIVVNIEKSIKAKEKLSEENNVEHNALHCQYEQKSLQGRKRVYSTSSSTTEDVKKVKLNRTNWQRHLETVNNTVDTSKEVDRTEKIVELKNHEERSQLIRTDVPGPSIEFLEGDNITCGVQVAQARNEERGVSSIEKQPSPETFGYSNRIESNASTDTRESQQKAATENHIPVSNNTSPFSENFDNSASQGDEDDCISLFADSMLIDEYNVPEFHSKEAPLVTEKQYLMTDKVIDNYYRKNTLEFNEAYNVNYSDNSKIDIVPQKKKPDKIVMQKEKPIEIVPQREKLVKIVRQTRKPVRIFLETKNPVGIVPETNKPVGIVPETKKPVGIVPETKKPVGIVPETNKPVGIVPETKKPVGIVPETKKPVGIVPETKKPVGIVPETKKPVGIVPKTKKPVGIVPETEKPVGIVPETEKPVGIVPETKKPVGIVPETKKPVEIVPEMGMNFLGRKDIKARLTLNPQTQTLVNMGIVNQPSHNRLRTLFRGFCYRFLRMGSCHWKSCNFSHDIIPFLMQMYKRDETCFFEVIDDLIQQQYILFLESFYKTCSHNDRNPVCILKLLKKLSTSNVIKPHIAYDSIKEIIMCGVTVNQIVDILVTIVEASDTQFVTSITKILVNFVQSGNGWATLKPLFMRIDKLDEYIIEMILAECILTHQHVQDIYENVIRKLENESLRLNKEKVVFLIKQVHSIHRRIQGNVKVEEKVASTSVSIASPSPHYEPDIILYPVQTRKLLPKVWKNDRFDSNNNVQGRSSLPVLHPIDNVPSPYSERSRERFWKFYLDVHSLQEGLKHNDYKHVKKIMDEAETRQTSSFTTACYKILQRTIEHSQHHLSKLASLAVQDGATATFFKILIDVTIYILADMAERELWVLALRLLNNMEGILHEQSSFLKFDAVVTMLFCEIYLANRKPMKAYNLLKQSNILYTYRGKWKVQNNEKDDNIRAQRVTILLDMFCDMSPENAFNLFEFLIEDQNSNFYPIDLTYQVNKIVSSLLLRNDHELIIDIGKLIHKYNCILHPITYRALISSLVRIDLPLAKQLYQSAVVLGIYPEMQFHPVMHVIVQCDWTSEEMFLAIWAMLRKLLENLGHAIEGVKQHNLSSYLVFETTLLDKHIVNDVESEEQYENQINESINLMKQVLKTEFHPPLLLVKNRKGKFQKLSSPNLCQYLKCIQTNGMQYV